MIKHFCGFGEGDCIMFLIVNLWKLMTLRVGVFMTLGAWFSGFIKRITKHYYKQNMKALCLVVSEKIMCFKFFS